VPFTFLQHCPIDPEQVPARVHFRDAGAGPAVVLLHGGWGHDAYPFDDAVAALAPHRRAVVPDRIGYGQSGRPLRELPHRFHERMAEELVLLLDQLGIRSATLWGHSDGAVVAAWTAILYPERVDALLLEALHFVAAKPSSIEFFRTAVEAPERFGDPLVEVLEREHGPAWRGLLGAGGRAWLRIIEEGARGRPDLYDGRFSGIRVPTLLLHGTRDPRTEPGEIDATLAALPEARIEWFDASHSPHTGSTSAGPCVAAAARFVESISPRRTA
jgi:pimeloyl-ACP methyl ester carboxylesterase